MRLEALLQNLSGEQRVEAEALLNALKEDHGKILEIVEYKHGDWILYAGTRHPLTGDPEVYEVRVDSFGFVHDKELPKDSSYYEQYTRSINPDY